MGLRTKIALGLTLLMAATVSARAQISLSSAVELALKNDPRVKMAEADLAKAKASLAEVNDAYIPTAGITGGYGTSTGVPLGVPVVFGFQSNSLVFNFSQKDYVRAAASGLVAAQLALQEMRDKVAEDTVVTYLELDNAQQRETAMGEEYGYATRLVTIVQERLDGGQDTKMDLLRARRTAAQIHLNELHTEDDEASLVNHLARLMGLPGTPLMTVPGSIPSITGNSRMAEADGDSFAIQSAFAAVKSKQETAFGESRYRFRPQVSFGFNYSRISTSQTDYVDYYPGFKLKSDDAASVGIQIQIPLFDRAHQDKARAAEAEAARSRYEAEDQRNQFLEGRFKLRHSIAELEAKSDLAQIDHEIAQDQLDTVLIQLSSATSGTGGQTMTPKDEQSARVQERQRTIDLLNSQLEVRQAQVNLMRQTGTLDDWLASSLSVTATMAAKH
jgi:outer membrane protein TolC